MDSRTKVYHIKTLYIVPTLFSFTNDLCVIKNDPCFKRFSPLAFYDNNATTNVHIIIGIGELKMLFNIKNEAYSIPTFFVNGKLFLFSDHFNWIVSGAGTQHYRTARNKKCFATISTRAYANGQDHYHCPGLLACSQQFCQEDSIDIFRYSGKKSVLPYKVLSMVAYKSNTGTQILDFLLGRLIDQEVITEIDSPNHKITMKSQLEDFFEEQFFNTARIVPVDTKTLHTESTPNSTCCKRYQTSVQWALKHTQ